MTLAADTTAMYKGRKYRLAWAGDTKYGKRAKLQFFDGTKEFWVDWSKVQVVESGTRGSGRSARRHRDCEDCLSMGPCGPDCEYAHIYRR